MYRYFLNIKISAFSNLDEISFTTLSNIREKNAFSCETRYIPLKLPEVDKRAACKYRSTIKFAFHSLLSGI